MNRKEYKRTGAVLVIIAVSQFLILGCVVRTVCDIEWLEDASFLLFVALLSCGTGMLINARNEKNYKKIQIEEKDERNKLINLNSCGVTLFISIICYVGVFIYMKSAGIISGLQVVVFGIPVYVGSLVYGLSVLYFRKRI